ncbi:Sec-independent protein translocase subunit TatA/TatB [Pedobacter nyackensis]|uniref:Sec-independent protein translocase protein TatA n=1 Tax=Pedobacter nyackensis TaxID=475255 RepID=A0A1W2C413_9SPHI|nr:twin-arginine translocase TatA/TatE family subunit [Pedobacter nyackensis]SMC79893.1 sec-independent protein translocase protein TatA [Pedobacter nyackensis]
MYTGTLVEFLNMGGGEIMLILAVVLLLFGGKKLPELARGLGKGLRDFKDASEGVKREIHRNINSVGVTDEINDFKSMVSDADNSRHHPYEYSSGGGQNYNDEGSTPHHSSDNGSQVESVDQTEKVASVESIHTAQNNHSDNTTIETDKTKI